MDVSPLRGRPWAARRAADLLKSCATPTLFFGDFPTGWFYTNVFITAGMMILMWGAEVGLSSWAVDTSDHPLPSIDPVVPFALSLIFLSIHFFLHDFGGKRKSRELRIQGVSLLYLAVCLAATAGYCFALNASLQLRGTTVSSGAGLITDARWLGGDGEPPALFTCQLLILLFILGTGSIRSSRAMVGATTMQCVWLALALPALIDNGHSGIVDVLLAVAVAATFANLTVGLSFSMMRGGPRYARNFSDAVSVAVGLSAFLFYYSRDPALLLSSLAPVIALIGLVLLIEDWGHPRLAGNG